MLHSLVLSVLVGLNSLPAAEPHNPSSGAAATRVLAHTSAVVTPLWRRPVVRTGMHRKLVDSLSTPAISGRHNRVIVGTGEGIIYALHVADGSVIWRRSYRAPMVSEAIVFEVPEGRPSANKTGAVGRELAALGASDGKLLAIDVLTGALVWKVDLDFEVTAAPTVADGKLIVTSETNQVVALDARTGQILWSQARPTRLALTMQGHARPAVAHNKVFCAFSDGFAMAMSLDTGEIAWARPLSLRSGSFIDADASPIVVDNTVFVASLTDGVYALTADGGETLWHHEVPDVVSLVHTGHVLFAADTSGQIYLLDPERGTQRNKVRLDARPAGALVDLGDAVALTAGPLGLVLLAPNTGKPMGTQSLGGLPGGELSFNHGLVAHLTRSGHVMLWQHEADVGCRHE